MDSFLKNYKKKNSDKEFFVFSKIICPKNINYILELR